VHPGVRLFKGCLSVWLRGPFADPETPNVNFVAKALGNLVDEVVLVFLRFHIDVSLGEAGYKIYKKKMIKKFLGVLVMATTLGYGLRSLPVLADTAIRDSR
jgi:hypothetical protein